MWTRADLKDRAKRVLAQSYWKALVVTTIIAILCEGFFNNSKYEVSYRNGTLHEVVRGNWSELFLPIMSLTLFVVIVIVAIFIFSILIANPLEVGGAKYFLDSTKMHFSIDNLSYSFTNRRYWNIVKVTFMQKLFIFLWSLLFIIPGIIKGYAYCMVPYILAENPNLDYDTAIQLSIKMTDDEKFDIFVLDLSFILWNILCSLIPLVGPLLLKPYTSATRAELYLVLKEKAIAMNHCSESTFYDNSPDFM